jgi:hypothetical protein
MKKEKYNRKDKRRLPYNLWIVFLSLVILSTMIYIGTFFINVSIEANTVTTDITQPNWQLSFLKILSLAIGTTFALFGFILAIQFCDKRFW